MNQLSPQNTHQHFIDWMKAVGMLIIVYGHVLGDINPLTLPINFKQLGVAFFVFAMGWSLANDSREGLRVVFNRAFPVFFYGLLFAVLLSAIFLVTKNTLNLSNYLPLAAGINVFFNYFPANPTTWYIGTYFHLLLFWFVLMQGRRITLLHLVIAFIVENLVRSLLLGQGVAFTAYMLLPNWLSVFLLGMYFYQQKDSRPSPVSVVLLLAWLGLFIGWGQFAALFDFSRAFPFFVLGDGSASAIMLQSLMISVLYIGHSLLFFTLARHLPGSRLVSFFARNTLIIFIAHMPIIFELGADFYSLFESKHTGRLVFVVVLYVGLAVFSELLQKIINVKSLGAFTWKRLQPLLAR